jgi:hypothetical protein
VQGLPTQVCRIVPAQLFVLAPMASAASGSVTG